MPNKKFPSVTNWRGSLKALNFCHRPFVVYKSSACVLVSSSSACLRACGARKPKRRTRYHDGQNETRTHVLVISGHATTTRRAEWEENTCSSHQSLSLKSSNWKRFRFDVFVRRKYILHFSVGCFLSITIRASQRIQHNLQLNQTMTTNWSHVFFINCKEPFCTVHTISANNLTILAGLLHWLISV